MITPPLPQHLNGNSSAAELGGPFWVQDAGKPPHLHLSSAQPAGLLPWWHSLVTFPSFLTLRENFGVSLSLFSKYFRKQ